MDIRTKWRVKTVIKAAICVAMWLPLCSCSLRILLLLLLGHWWGPVVAEKFLMGYLTGAEKIREDQEYRQPGRTISGAINLAMHEIKTRSPLVDGK